jgi:hypothetical protein
MFMLGTPKKKQEQKTWREQNKYHTAALLLEWYSKVWFCFFLAVAIVTKKSRIRGRQGGGFLEFWVIMSMLFNVRMSYIE